MGIERAHIRIRGIVQGVGFRPFIHREVKARGISGSIRNTSSGVELELEGEGAVLRAFERELPAIAPKLAVIESVESEYSAQLRGYSGFTIEPSLREESRNTLISPDIAICDDCLRELRDPADRRYRYPFINCTNCGPRFTIIKDVPYDRPKTSMGAFPMCPECDREYHDIENRRYHAQPDCCPECGPRVFFLDGEGREVPGDAIETARGLIKQGKIVAVKGLGGIHLACRCDDESAVRELRRRKQRDEKPFAVMCRDVQCAERLCLVSGSERALLESFRRPIVLLGKRQRGLEYLSENGYLGVMLPYTPLHYLLFGEDTDMLVMTSANLSDTPMIYGNSEATEKLRGIADGFLLHDRDIQTRCDDSLCWEYEGREYFARRSRGYAPFPIQLHRDVPMIIACGAEQKASFCLSKGSYVFLSQHIGDLKNIETLENYESQTEHFKRLFDIEPAAAVCDLHPDYLSTEYARSLGLPLYRVQHHHAHMASCMADNGLEGEVIGLVWDGTGLGTDGTVWGGECLTGGYEGFRRFGSVLPIPLPGGDKAVKETERVAFSLLKLSGLDTGCIGNSAGYGYMMDNSVNTPLSSGMGRLFDGVAAILDIKRRCSYEGQGAVLLEAEAEACGEEYPVSFTGNVMAFDWREMIRCIVADRDGGVEKGVICAKFMNTLIKMAVMQCEAAGRQTGLDRVVLSGGSFQNMYIMARLPERLRRAGFQVYTHRRVSANDEGISLGQLMIADAMMKKDK